MPKLVLLFEGRVLKETAVSHTAAVTIGRLADNAIVIDNPAVSSHHVRIAREGPQFVVEDLGSTNGTFVNGDRVTKRALRHGDTILVGKHKIFFDRMGEAEFDAPDVPGRDMPDFGGTVILDADQQQRLLAAAQARLQARTASHQATAPAPAEAKACSGRKSGGGIARLGCLGRFGRERKRVQITCRSWCFCSRVGC